MTRKLKIKLALPEEITPPPETYVYHWDRIIFVSILGLLLLVSLGFGIRAFVVNSSHSELAQQEEQQENSSEPPSTTSSTVISQSSTDSGNEFNEDTSSSANLALQVNNSQSESIKTVIAPEPTPPPKEAPVDKPERSTEIAAETVAENTVIEPIPSSDKEISTQITQMKETDLFDEIKTEIYSPHITRFMLTNKVINNEPRGSIEDVTLDNNNLAAVYAYSDAENLKDKTLKYIWKFKNKKIAQVNIGVWSNRWRSYSSKLIQEHMGGDWEVELRDKNGELLAVSQFKYQPPLESVPH